MRFTASLALSALAPLAFVHAQGSASEKLVPLDAARFDNHGVSCAVDGDTIVVGAYRKDGFTGAAYVYRRGATGWEQVAKLIGHDAGSGDYFGAKVALSGERLAVGAHGADDHGERSGAAYVYDRAASGWIERVKLTASDAHAGDQLGIDVALDGERLLVGAFGDDDQGSSSGSAYVFERRGGTWTEVAKLSPSCGAPGDHFGWRVALSGGAAVIGAPMRDGRGVDSGAAYVYELTDAGWQLATTLMAFDAWGGGRFGHSVALRGDVIAVGSPTDCDPSNGTDTGSAYVYERRDGGWMLAAKLTAADAHDGDWFGWDVAVTDDAVLVGKRWGDERSPARSCNSGSAYLFRRDAHGWVQAARLVPSDGACGDEFGYSVALAPEHALVGAWLTDDACSGFALLAGAGAVPVWDCDSGAAYVFETGALR